MVHWVAQPLWWDKETSYYRKYGLGRNGGPRAFGVARNIWIYTKEFLMPKKLPRSGGRSVGPDDTTYMYGLEN